VLARRIPEIRSIAAPATPAQIEALAATLGLELPEEYRALLAEANGVSTNLVHIYSAEEVPERNATYEVAGYAPGYLLVGTVNDFPVLLRAGRSSPVYENDWGAMTPDVMEELAPSLATWIERGCPDREGPTTATD
jgi:hypothetical protein